jgi:CBS domain-containing protein
MINQTVDKIMTVNLKTVQPDTPISEAIKLLIENKISGLPVVDQQGKLLGILTEGDLMWQESGLEAPHYIMILDSVIYLQNPARHEKEVHKVLGKTVGEVMSDKVITITSGRTVKEAAILMHDKKLSRLPVIEEKGGKLIGIVTQSDILRTMID